jgi:hypothetical protein
MAPINKLSEYYIQGFSIVMNESVWGYATQTLLNYKQDRCGLLPFTVVPAGQQSSKVLGPFMLLRIIEDTKELCLCEFL